MKEAAIRDDLAKERRALSALLRSILIACGGGLYVLTVNTASVAKYKVMHVAFEPIWRFALGVALQVGVVFMRKYLLVFFGPGAGPTLRDRLVRVICRSAFFELCVDLATIILYASGAYWLFLYLLA
ncbi:hypothetical protein ACFL09_01590 [Planctomycetota bacterium]